MAMPLTSDMEGISGPAGKSLASRKILEKPATNNYPFDVAAMKPRKQMQNFN
jgi:hypothetical protein